MQLQLPRNFSTSTTPADIARQRLVSNIQRVVPRVPLRVANRAPQRIENYQGRYADWAQRLQGRPAIRSLAALGAWTLPAGVPNCYDRLRGTVIATPTTDGPSIDPRCMFNCFDCLDLASLPDYFQRGYSIAKANRYSAPFFYEDGSVLIQAGQGGVPMITYVNRDGTVGRTLNTGFDNRYRPSGAYVGAEPLMTGDPRFVRPPDDVLQRWFGAFDWSAFHAAYVAAVTQAQQQSQQAASQVTGPGADPASYVPPGSTSVTTTPPPQPITTTTGASPVYSPRVTFATSRGSTALQPGDSWTITITGGQPGAEVTAQGNHDGQVSTMTFGLADAQGNFQLQGMIEASSSGNWTETWYVGGVNAGTFSFTVSVPSGVIPPSTAGGSNTPVPSPGNVTVSPPGTVAQQQSSGGGDFIAGINNKTLLLGAGALMLFLTMMGGRR